MDGAIRLAFFVGALFAFFVTSAAIEGGIYRLSARRARLNQAKLGFPVIPSQAHVNPPAGEDLP